MTETLHKTSGWIDIFEVRGGVWLPLGGQHNMITRQGGDVMAAALAGLRKINCVYFAYSNQPGALEIGASEHNTAATYRAAVAGRGVARSLALSSPCFASSGDGFAANRMTVTAVTSGSKLSGEDMADGVSAIYHAALVSVADEGDAQTDMVFSCANLDVERVKSAGAQIGVRWTLNCLN
jgi:hypothetical protein